MDRAGSEKVAFARAVPGAANLQRELARAGLPVEATGTLDQPTVDAVNTVLRGFPRAPAKYTAGDLSAEEIARDLPSIAKYVSLATAGAKPEAS